VKLIDEEFGRHAGFHHRAMSKQEVAAALCRVGILVGFWSVPEFEIKGMNGAERRIDVVWAMRIPLSGDCMWKPVAAFEIEGHDVALAPGSIRKNADSLTAARRDGADVLAMVLFQVGPKGQLWHRAASENSTTRVQETLTTSLKELNSTAPVEVLLDQELFERLESWVQRASVTDGSVGPPVS